MSTPASPNAGQQFGPVSPGHQFPAALEVDMPSGGKLPLFTVEEVDFYEETRDKYVADFKLAKQNDLMLLTALLAQAILSFRAQQRMNGLIPETDASGLPNGRYKSVPVSTTEMSACQKVIITAAKEIRETEQALGIDKKTREAGGGQSGADYLRELKRAGHEYGVHIAARVKAYERVVMEARTRLRMLNNLDTEDRQYHNVTPKSICDWLTEELAALEEVDRKFAREKGKLFIGKV